MTTECWMCGHSFEPENSDAAKFIRFCSSECEYEYQSENHRERGDDDGVEYADPRDYKDGLE